MAIEDNLDYIRKTYGVPAHRGGHVRYITTGKLGIIKGSSGPHVLVLLMGEQHAKPYHPTDLEYL